MGGRGFARGGRAANHPRPSPNPYLVPERGPQLCALFGDDLPLLGGRLAGAHGADEVAGEEGVGAARDGGSAPPAPAVPRRPLPRRSGPPHLPAAPASTTLASERTMFVAQGAAAFASAGCLGLMARAASRRAAAAAA